VSDLEEFKTAFRALRVARHFSLPWDFSIIALESFLYNSNFCAADLQSNGQRSQVLTAFVNYVLGLNAQRWTRQMNFLDTGEIENLWPSFFRTRVPSAAIQTAPASAAHHTFTGQQQPQANKWRNRGPQPRAQGGQARDGVRQPAAGGLVAKALMNAQAASGYQPGHPICRRYNYGDCRNPDNGCFAQSGSKLWHVCNLCHDAHPRKGNH